MKIGGVDFKAYYILSSWCGPFRHRYRNRRKVLRDRGQAPRPGGIPVLIPLSAKRELAQRMRARPTPAEAALWARLNRNQLGHRFCRQTLLSGYIVDFYCAKVRLVIEVDGSVHELAGQRGFDAVKQNALEARGFLVLRFANRDVLDCIQVVLVRISGEMERSTKNTGVIHKMLTSVMSPKQAQLLAASPPVHISGLPTIATCKDTALETEAFRPAEETQEAMARCLKFLQGFRMESASHKSVWGEKRRALARQVGGV